MMKSRLKACLALNMVVAVCLLLSVNGSGSAQGRIADYHVMDDDASQTVATAELPWYIEKVNADDVWKSTAAGENILVAVLDTGIDAAHEDLAGKVVAGVNFSSGKTSADVNGHGTVTAGIITASFENLKGATGIAYNSSLLNVKVAGDNGFVNPDAVAKGIIWAVDRGAQVINLSLTLSQPSEEVEAAVKYAWEKGAVIIAAAGNSASAVPVYPASSPNVIGVAATDKNDRLTKWSNRGSWISVSAPGVDILSTLPSNKYAVKSGTSYATALVSGEAALLMAIAKDCNGNGRVNDEVRDAILKNTEMRADGATAGRVNVEKAVNSLMNRH
jgi:thermitase